MLFTRELTSDDDPVAVFLALRGIDEFDGMTIVNLGERPRRWIDDEVVQNYISTIGNREVVFHTDYDTDGITSAGVARSYYMGNRIIVPERMDGYGLSPDILNEVTPRNALVTADCGITAWDIVNDLNSAKIPTVITDHHVPSGPIPRCMVVHPRILGSRFTGYSGAGVLYKLMSAVNGEKPEALQYAAIGTVADMMPMLDENRLIVREGLSLIRSEPLDQIAALVEALGKKVKYLTYTDIAFYLSPTINSCGRMGEASTALEWVNSKSYSEALASAKNMVRLNQDRKSMMEEVIDNVEVLHQGRISFLLAPQGVFGVAGLVASGVMANSAMPTIVINRGDTSMSASARAPRWFDLVKYIEWLSNRADISGGGHKSAAGFKIHDPGELSKIIMLSEEYMDTVRVPVAPQEAYVDFGVPINLLPEVASKLHKLEPFGVEFERPTLASVITVDDVKVIGSDRNHVRLTANDIDFLLFYPEDVTAISPGDTLQVAYEIDTPYSFFTKRPAMIVRDWEFT